MILWFFIEVEGADTVEVVEDVEVVEFASSFHLAKGDIFLTGGTSKDSPPGQEGWTLARHRR